MSKPPRPGLDVLPFATKKPATPAAPEVVEAVPVATPANAKDDRVTIIIRVSAEDRKALKGISVEQDTTIQDMLHAAMRDFIWRSK